MKSFKNILEGILKHIIQPSVNILCICFIFVAISFMLGVILFGH